jgi:hypothetical protein
MRGLLVDLITLVRNLIQQIDDFFFFAVSTLKSDVCLQLH